MTQSDKRFLFVATCVWAFLHIVAVAIFEVFFAPTMLTALVFLDILIVLIGGAYLLARRLFPDRKGK